ncbi:hypothetical protein [Massilia antarctica]|uniref:hypothetical protein n=1 Tax=Massilia antarctica TaxID=2765360 RepID=UPI0006BB62E9|nr:hypothetical protein [Massilia sp. H27-R4]MCY0914545.1 hypothetical protein [Massilia sp. H27-R4]
MYLPTTSDERFDFLSTLQSRLKPEGFWLTDFLAQRLHDVEWTFCGGVTEDGTTVKLCAEYCRDLLLALQAGKVNCNQSLQMAAISAPAKAEVQELFVLEKSVDANQMTTLHACSAVSAFLQLVYTLDFG